MPQVGNGDAVMLDQQSRVATSDYDMNFKGRKTVLTKAASGSLENTRMEQTTTIEEPSSNKKLRSCLKVSR